MSSLYILVINPWKFLFYLFKDDIEILMGIALNLYIALSNLAILTLLIYPIHEHRLSFHFVFLISFNNAL